MIEYPLRKKRRTGLTSEFFRNAKSNANPFHPEELKIEYKGQWFRSKNEMSAAQIIESMGYDFKSEVHVQIKGSENEHYPTVFDPEHYELLVKAAIEANIDDIIRGD